MRDEDLLKLMKDETPYLPDDGFSALVLAELPVRRRFRIQILAASFTLASLLAATIWVACVKVESLAILSSPLALSTSAIAFWSFIAFFAFVAIGEGVFEV